MIAKVAAGCAGAAALAYLAFTLWVATLPKLDPTGALDSAPAIRAMIEGHPVLNASSGRVLTKTGWPFFERYSPQD